MVTILDRLDRLDALKLTRTEALGALGYVAGLAPEVLDKALNDVETQRAETERRAAA